MEDVVTALEGALQSSLTPDHEIPNLSHFCFYHSLDRWRVGRDAGKPAAVTRFQALAAMEGWLASYAEAECGRARFRALRQKWSALLARKVGLLGYNF